MCSPGLSSRFVTRKSRGIRKIETWPRPFVRKNSHGRFSVESFANQRNARSIVLFAFPRSFVISRRLAALREKGRSVSGSSTTRKKGVSNHQQLFGIPAYITNVHPLIDALRPLRGGRGWTRSRFRARIPPPPPPPHSTEIPSTLIIIMRIRLDPSR